MNEKRRLKYKQNEAKRRLKESKMTKRDIRARRKKWREAKCLCKEKLKIANQNNPSEDDKPSPQSISAKKKSARKRRKCYYENEKLRAENAKLRKNASMYRQRYYRLRSTKLLSTTTSTSPRSQLEKALAKHSLKISAKTKRRLLFGEAFATDVSTAWRSMPKKEKGKLPKILIF